MIDFNSEEEPSEERNMSKAKICSRCLVWEQEDLLDGIKNLDLDVTNGRLELWQYRLIVAKSTDVQ